jgi:hypothetical protein
MFARTLQEITNWNHTMNLGRLRVCRVFRGKQVETLLMKTMWRECSEMNAIESLRLLQHLGYRFEILGDLVRYQYTGPGNPDLGQIRPLLNVVKANKNEVRRYLSQDQSRVNLPERIISCAECPWHQANPWTHYPELPAWCGYHFDHLTADNPACIGYRKGEIPPPR